MINKLTVFAEMDFAKIAVSIFIPGQIKMIRPYEFPDYFLIKCHLFFQILVAL